MRTLAFCMNVTWFSPKVMAMVQISISINRAQGHGTYLVNKLRKDLDRMGVLFVEKLKVFLLLRFPLPCPDRFNVVLRTMETRLDLECSSLASNEHASSKNPKQLSQIQNAVSDLSVVPLAFFQNRILSVC